MACSIASTIAPAGLPVVGEGAVGGLGADGGFDVHGGGGQ
jgi:hypothetical protein